MDETLLTLVDPAVWVRVFDALPEPLMYVSCDCKIRRVNAAQANLLGARATACEGRYCYELLHGTSTPLDNCPCEQVKRDGTAKTVTFGLAATGNSLLVTISPIRDSRGRVSGLLHTARQVVTGSGRSSDAQLAGHACETDLQPHASSEARLMFDRLLSFVLHQLGQQAQEARKRATLLIDFVDMLSEFAFDNLSLWQAGSHGPQAVFQHTFDHSRRPAPTDSQGTDHPAWMLQTALRTGFVRTVQDGVVKCAVPMSSTVTGSSTYIMLVECAENTPSCSCLQPEPMRFLCEVLGQIVRHAAIRDDASLGGNLTRRETAVMRLLEGNYPCKAIASQLGVSIHTAHVHIRNIYRKLLVHTRAEAVQRWRTSRWSCCREPGSVQTDRRAP